jgi:sterol desaturase/sphingolipid hydroxylase (fatty acid hydroxylase superfamily)
MIHELADTLYPFFLAIVFLELFLIFRDPRHKFSTKESLTSLVIAIGYKATATLFSFIPIVALSWAWQHRVFTIPIDRFWGVLLLFLGSEFFYYLHHRAAHEIRWIWATHAVHHSSRYFNLSASYRLGWTGWLSGNFLFFMPLCWLGFPPTYVAIALSLNLMYQFWLHTELIPKLGWLEWVLNTPSHHRVHHGSNSEYIDRNYGGVLIVFDRLFGTFAVEDPHLAPIYGLTHPLPTANPIAIAFHEWLKLAADLIATKTWQERIKIVFGRPI